MDYLQATTADGFLRASTCDSPGGFGERFRATMELQGYTVTRYTPEELARLRTLPVVRTRENSQESPEIVNQTAPEQTPLQSQTTIRALPEVGAEIVTPLLGGCTVTHWLTWPDGTRTAVARSGKGEGMVREWETASSPVTPQPSVDTAAEPAPLPELPPVPVAGGWQMPSLFEGLA